MAGVGTELAKLASWFGSASKCQSCQQKAELLDKKGPEWAEEHIDTIVTWLQRAAQRNYLMTLIPTAITREAARAMVKLAISRSRN